MSGCKVVDWFWVDEDLKIKAVLRSNSPSWYMQFNLPGVGQRKRSLNTASKKQARLKGYDFARRFAAGEVTGTPLPRATVGATIEAYCHRLRSRGRTPETVGHAERFLGQLTAYLPRGAATPLRGLTLPVLEGFERELRDRGISVPPKPNRKRRRSARPLASKTLRDALKAVRGLLRFGLQRGLINSDPAVGYELPPQPEYDIVVLSEAVLASLFADPDGEMAETWRFMVETCLRAAEFCWLTRDDVRLDDHGRPNAILIRKKTCAFTGRTWKPKHGVERVVPLSATAADIVAKALTVGLGPWLFSFDEAAGKQGKKWTYTALLRRLHKRLQVIGAGRRGLHAFRHTGATFLANDGRMPLVQLQKFLGHTDLDMTRRYLHPSADDVAASIARVDYGKLDNLAPRKAVDARPSDEGRATAEVAGSH